MPPGRVAFWLLASLNLLTGAAVLFLALDAFTPTRYLIDDGILVTCAIAAFVLIPVGLLAAYGVGRKPASPRTRGQRLFVRLSVAFLAAGWLVIAAPALFWGAIFIAAREPWPLSLAQGPDTERARAGADRLFGAEAAQAMSAVYFYTFNLRDASYFARFEYRDPGVVALIAERKDLVRVPDSVRDDTRFDLRANRTRWSWWRPDEINSSDVVYVDRPTSRKIAGTLARGTPLGVARVLWLDRSSRTAYYREIEF